MVNLLSKLVIILGCISLSVRGVIGGPTTVASSNVNRAANVNHAQFDEESIGSIQDVAVEADLFDGDSMMPFLSLEEQVRLLTKQLNTLTNQRREDYKMLENNLKKYVHKNSIQLTNAEIRDELDHLR